MRLVALILTSCFCVGAAHADVLHLAGGKTYEGQVELAGARYFVVDRDMKWAFKKEQVVRWEKSESFMDLYEVHLAKLQDDDADAMYEFGRWLEKNGWSSRARRAFQEAMHIDEDHRAARRALGYRLYEGEWLSPDEINEAKGLVKFEGRWYTPHDLANLKHEIETNETLKSQRATMKRVNANVNGIIRRFATFDKGARKRAYEDLSQYADKLERTEALGPMAPQVRKLADDVKAYYDHMHHILCAKMLARTEIRATLTQLKQPIETFSTQLGQAIAFIAGQSPVTIQLPELRIAEIKTTVDIPAGCR